MATDNKVTEIDIDDLMGSFELGKSYGNQSESGKAIEVFTKLIALNPEFISSVYFERGEEYYYNNDYNNAIEDYTRAIDLAFENATIYWHRGCAYKTKNDYKKTFFDVSKAFQIDADYSENLETIVEMILKNNPYLFWEIELEKLKISSNFFVGLIVRFIEADLSLDIYKNLIVSIIKFWNLCHCSRYNRRMIYQYTNLQTLEIMRKNRRLRLNPASYLNDPNEGKIFFKYLKRYFEKKTGKVFELNTKNENITTFIRSLTDLNDSILMWNSSYGDNGLGVSVGLTQKSISKSNGKGLPDQKEIGESSKHFSSNDNEKYIPINMVGLYRVQYISLDENEKNQTRSERTAQELIARIADNLIICMDELKDNDKKDYFFKLLSELFASIAHLIKDKSYSHEREYRLMCSCSLQNEYYKKYIHERKDAKSNIFQGFYIETEGVLFENREHKIIFGPKVDDSTIHKYKQAFIYDNLANVTIEKSKQDFR
jgi:tetratricopeptide (TPR) repeat protein